MGVSRALRDSRTHAPHRDPLLLALIWIGGTLGTVTRALVARAWPVVPGTFPYTTLLINLTGAVVLSFLLEGLGRRGPDTGWRRLARLAVGTGVLGGYTTYSTFAVETVQALAASPLVGAGYAVATIVGGPLAAVVGYYAARRIVPAVRRDAA